MIALSTLYLASCFYILSIRMCKGSAVLKSLTIIKISSTYIAEKERLVYRVGSHATFHHSDPSIVPLQSFIALGACQISSSITTLICFPFNFSTFSLKLAGTFMISLPPISLTVLTNFTEAMLLSAVCSCIQ